MPRMRTQRALAVSLAAGLALTGGTLMAGCAKFDAALGRQELVVDFKPGTPTATRLKVRAACSHVPRAKPEPLPKDHLLVDTLYDVRFLVSSASAGEITELVTCVTRFPSVAGTEEDGPGD